MEGEFSVFSPMVVLFGNEPLMCKIGTIPITINQSMWKRNVKEPQS